MTTLIEELEQAAKDADETARSYRLVAPEMPISRRAEKIALFEARAARLRARAERVRELEATLRAHFLPVEMLNLLNLLCGPDTKDSDRGTREGT